MDIVIISDNVFKVRRNNKHVYCDVRKDTNGSLLCSCTEYGQTGECEHVRALTEYFRYSKEGEIV